MQYRSLNDAAKLHPGLAKGRVEIWYMKTDSFRDFSMGVKWIEKQGLMPTTDTLEKTHILLGSIKEANLEKIYHWMQGDMWSPEGEAHGLIKNKRLSHTSMSMGDIVKIGNTMHIVDMVGFKKISESIDEAVNKKALTALMKLNKRERMFMFNFFVSGNKKEPESGMNYNMDLGLYNYPHKTAMKGMYHLFAKLSAPELRELEKAAKRLPQGKKSLEQQARDELGEAKWSWTERPLDSVVPDAPHWEHEESVDEQWRPTDFRQLFPTPPPDLRDTRPLDALRRRRPTKPTIDAWWRGLSRSSVTGSESEESLVEAKQKLLTAQIRKQLPDLYSQDEVADPMVYVKFFNPYGAGTWLVTEFDGKDRMFGYVMGLGSDELGYISLRELESLEGRIAGRTIRGMQGIERDSSFRPTPLSKAAKANGGRFTPMRESLEDEGTTLNEWLTK